MFESSWFILVMILIIVGSVVYLVMRGWWSDTAVPPPPINELHKKRPVQCPKCQRWKELKPIHSNRDQIIAANPQASHIRNQVQYSNRYKCPFCGHRWQEEYTL